MGSVGAGTLAWAGGPAAARAVAAGAAALDYDSPAAFAEAQAAYLAIDPPDNETGLYAWGESYFLLGLLRMYEATDDPQYLDTFEQRADHLLATTDAARGVTDYRGVSGPVWRAAGNYTAGHGTLAAADGQPLVQLRWAGSRSGESTAVVSNVSGDTFDLQLANPATATVVTLTGVSLDPAAAGYVVDAVNAAYATSVRWTAVDLRPAPVAEPAPQAGTVAFDPQFYAFAVHTGMIVHPLALYARMVVEAPAAHGGRAGRARQWLDAVRASIDFHAEEFVVRADGIGDYVWPKGAPVPFDGTIQPYNQSNAVGQAMAEVFRATGGRHYGAELRAMIAGLRHGLVLDADGAYVWRYWPVHSQLYGGYAAADGVSEYTPSYQASRQVEDISHAAITLEFVYAAHGAGIDAGLATDMGRFTDTFTRNVVRSPTEVWLRVDGTADAVASNAVQCARWMPCTQLDPLVHQQSLRVYEAVGLVPEQGSHALGIAYLNWAARQAWENR